MKDEGGRMKAVQIRAYRPADLDALVALINAADAVDDVGYTTTARLLAGFLHRPGREPARDVFLAELDGQLVGYVRVEPRRGPHEDIIRCEGAVLPVYRRRGIGALLMQHAYRRAGELKSDHPAHFDVHARQGRAGLNELAQSLGMQPARYFFWMLHPDLNTIEESALPTGFRLVDCTTFHDLEARTAAYNEAFAQHWGHAPITVEDTRHMVQQPTYQPENSLIALDEAGEEAGFCTADTTPDVVQSLGGDKGRVSTLGVRPKYRHRGLGRALLLSGMHNIRAAGLPRAALGVDGDNVTGATRLYESVGFCQERWVVVYRRDLEGRRLATDCVASRRGGPPCAGRGYRFHAVRR
jgi:mycothiol synthase